MQIKSFLMMGRPGSGKGTQAQLLAEKIGGRVFSSGAEFRKLAASDKFLGRRLKAGMESGELMPHWLASYIYEEELFEAEPDDILVFEGACRTEAESMLFHEISLWLPRQYVAVNLEINDEETVGRLLKRKEVESRADDDESAIRMRIAEYARKTAPGIEFFRKQGTLVGVNGEQSIEKVHQDILAALKLG